MVWIFIIYLIVMNTFLLYKIYKLESDMEGWRNMLWKLQYDLFPTASPSVSPSPSAEPEPTEE